MLILDGYVVAWRCNTTCCCVRVMELMGGFDARGREGEEKKDDGL